MFSAAAEPAVRPRQTSTKESVQMEKRHGSHAMDPIVHE